MAVDNDRPLARLATGTETFTITEAHPYHRAVYTVDHKGAGIYEGAYDPHCLLCREEEECERNA